jgi:hypothetical protein
MLNKLDLQACVFLALLSSESPSAVPSLPLPLPGSFEDVAAFRLACPACGEGCVLLEGVCLLDPPAEVEVDGRFVPRR